MSISLVGDYGGSGSSSESESEEEHAEDSQKKMVPPSPKVTLPSAEDLFGTVESASFMSNTVPAPSSPVEVKRKIQDISTKGSMGNKKGKPENHDSKRAEKPKGFIPPQISRPNVVTEDSSLWSSDASKKRQKQIEAERRSGSTAEASEKNKNKGLTFKEREKAKRDRGQQSRGKSWVEEEKRLLRELGSAP